MRILFGIAIALGLAFLGCIAPEKTWAPSAQAETIPPPTPTPSWRIDPHQFNMAVFILDYAGEAVKEAYFLQEPSCQTPLTTTVLTLKARTALSNTQTGQQLAIALNAGGKIPEAVGWQGEFFTWSVHLGDFTADALIAPCTGQPLFVGESIWMGHGSRPYPRNPLPAAALLHGSTPITAPSALASVTQTPWMTITAEAAWSHIADLNLLHDLAQQTFDTHAFLYRSATGHVDPLQELAHAEWVFLVYREPTARAQTPFEHYLPLTRQ